MRNNSFILQKKLSWLISFQTGSKMREYNLSCKVSFTVSSVVAGSKKAIWPFGFVFNPGFYVTFLTAAGSYINNKFFDLITQD